MSIYAGGLSFGSGASVGPDPGEVSHAFTVRVADCQASYDTLKGRGAEFLTPPFDWGGEIRCFFADLDGHLWEISLLAV